MSYRYIVLCCIVFYCISSCTGYSKYSIDDNPVNEIDESMLGIWKAVEDTVKEDFILIQSFDRTMEYVIKEYGSIENFIKNQTEIFKKDSTIIKRVIENNMWLLNNKQKLYFISRINNGGKGIVYQQFPSYVSKIGSVSFLNIPYRNEEEKGYLLIKMLKVTRDSITVVLVSDPKMSSLDNSQEVREKVIRSLNDKKFYGDTVHFYKVKGGDLDINNAIELAN